MPEFCGARSICDAGLPVADDCRSDIAGQRVGHIDAAQQTRMGWALDLHASG